MFLFCRAVEVGSFAGVARTLNMTPAIVGRHINALEGELGVRLFHRSTRAMEVTAEGNEYYQSCRRILEEIEHAEQRVAGGASEEVSGVIRVAAPDGLGSPFLLSCISEFQARHGDVLFDLLLENEFTDLVGESVDLAIRLVAEPDTLPTNTQKLGATEFGLYASRDYLSSRRIPTSIHDLKEHDCIHFGASRYGGSWPYLLGDEIQKLSLPWKMVFNQTHVFVDALRHHQGIGLAPQIMVAGALARGEIIEVDIAESFPSLNILAVQPSRKYVPKRIVMFLDHLSESAKRDLGVD